MIITPKKTFYNLIADIIDSAPRKQISVGDIYKQIEKYYPTTKNETFTWKNSVRHALSFKKVFMRLKPGISEHHKRGCLWTIDESLRDELTSPRRKRNHRPKELLTKLAEQRENNKKDYFSILDFYLNKYFIQKKIDHSEPVCPA